MRWMDDEGRARLHMHGTRIECVVFVHVCRVVCRQDAPFSELCTLLSTRVIPCAHVSLHFDGVELHPRATPQSMDMDTNDCIEATYRDVHEPT